MHKLIITTPDELQELVRRAVRQELDGHTAQSGVEKKYLSLEEAADFLDLPKATIYQFTSQRLIPFMKSGRRLRFVRAELEQWLAGRRKPTRQEIEMEVFTNKVVKR